MLIPGLDDGVSLLTGSDLFAISQNGVLRKATLDSIAELFGSGSGLGYTPINKAGDAFTGTPTFSGAATYSGAIGFTAAGTALSVTNNASIGGLALLGKGSINWIQARGQNGATAPEISTDGSDTNISLRLVAKGTGGYAFRNTTNTTLLQVLDGGGTATDFLIIKPAISGQPVRLSTNVANTSVDISPSGTGNVRIGNGAGKFVTGFINAGNANTVNWSTATGNGATFSPLFNQANHTSGATALNSGFGSGVFLNWFSIPADTIRYSGSQGVNGWEFDHNFGGSTSSGGRQAVQITLNQIGATQSHSSFSINPYFSALTVYSTANYNEGGSNPPTVATSVGHVFAGNFVARLRNTATGYTELKGIEINMSASSGTSYVNAGMLQLILEATHQKAGTSGGDFAIGITAQSGTGAFLDSGIIIGSPGSLWAFNDTATIFRGRMTLDFDTHPPTAANFIDMLAPTFTDYFLRSKGFSVTGDGVTQIGTGILEAISTGIRLGAPGAIGTAVGLQSGGSNYAVDEVFYFGPNNSGIGYVTAGSGGVVTTFTILQMPVSDDAGSLPSNPVATTSWRYPDSGGTGLTVNITWSTTRNGVTIAASGQKVGVFGATPQSKGTVTGSRGGNAALASLLTLLASYGWCVDSSS